MGRGSATHQQYNSGFSFCLYRESCPSFPDLLLRIPDPGTVKHASQLPKPTERRGISGRINPNRPYTVGQHKVQDTFASTSHCCAGYQEPSAPCRMRPRCLHLGIPPQRVTQMTQSLNSNGISTHREKLWMLGKNTTCADREKILSRHKALHITGAHVTVKSGPEYLLLGYMLALQGIFFKCISKPDVLAPMPPALPRNYADLTLLRGFVWT